VICESAGLPVILHRSGHGEKTTATPGALDDPRRIRNMDAITYTGPCFQSDDTRLCDLPGYAMEMNGHTIAL